MMQSASLEFARHSQSVADVETWLPPRLQHKHCCLYSGMQVLEIINCSSELLPFLFNHMSAPIDWKIGVSALVWNVTAAIALLAHLVCLSLSFTKMSKKQTNILRWSPRQTRNKWSREVFFTLNVSTAAWLLYSSFSACSSIWHLLRYQSNCAATLAEQAFCQH